MSINIHISADTVGELHHTLRQLLAGAAPAAVSSDVSTPAPTGKVNKAKGLTDAEKERAIKNAESQKADDAARQKLQDERDAAAAAAATAADAANSEAPGEPVSAAASTSSNSSVTGAASTGGATSAPAASSPAASTGEIDYETQIKPLVLKLAEAKGRDGVINVLDQYGVANAQLVPAERRAELLEHLNLALAA